MRTRMFGLAEDRAGTLGASDMVKATTIRRGPPSKIATSGCESGTEGVWIRFGEFGPRYTTMHATECPMFVFTVTETDLS